MIRPTCAAFAIAFATSSLPLAARAAQPAATSPRELAALCAALYKNGSGAPQAERALAAVPKPSIAKQLDALRKDAYRGTFAYTSASYAGAWLGIDSGANIRRVALAWYPPDTTPLKVLESEAVNPLPYLGAAIVRLYERSPDRATLLEVIMAGTTEDTEGIDLNGDHADAIGRLFFRAPAEMLRAAYRVRGHAFDANGVRRVAAALAGGGDYRGGNRREARRAHIKRVRAVLAEHEKSTDPEVARAARSCSRAMEDEMKHERYVP